MTMPNNYIIRPSGLDGITDSLTDLLRDGVRQLIQSTVEDELAQFTEQTTATGHRTVVRNDVVTHRSACMKAKLRFVGCFTRGTAAM